MDLLTTGSIKHWSEDDRPREKLMNKGRQALSNAELLAILIGSGLKGQSAVDVGKVLLKKVDNDLHKLSKLTIEEICEVKGLGPARAVTMIAALELGRRRKSQEVAEQPKLNSSKLAYEFFSPVFMDLDHEEFWVLYLSNANRVIQKKRLSAGGLTGTVVDVRLLFNEALQKKAAAIIVAHNHPSGQKKPSDNDIILTKRIREAGELLSIRLVDHLIYVEGGYYSFADEGML
ncbi:MAG: DNA repair protein RadC [Cryomorphaceae bacterium]|nr:DNA repair protein RadC [Cryomorphaceae bacterium]